MKAPALAIVIPCYRVRNQILDLLARIPPEVSFVFCVDDACPEESGSLIEASVQDPRVTVLRHPVNQGVGGAVITGYRAALEAGADLIVKLDGDGQMDPLLIPRLVRPIVQGRADYTKGNRFHHPDHLKGMPWLRLVGNAALSFASKFSTGYWTIFDPTNGFTAIHASVLRLLPLDRLAQRYFFESDLLFRLNQLRAVVMDIPMPARYQGEESSLSIRRILPIFLAGHGRNFLKRILYSYFLRDFNIASIFGLVGTGLVVFGIGFGLDHWWRSSQTGIPASAGTVMLSALPVLIGLEMLLSALNFDVASTPRTPIQDPPVPFGLASHEADEAPRAPRER